MVLELDRPRDGAGARVVADRERRVPFLWCAVGIGALLACGGAWVLRGSPFPPGGFAGDQGFRLASVARDAQHLVPVDFAYRGLPAFYPPLYFFLLGRVVAITGWAPYEVSKFGTLAVALVVPIFGFGLWRRVTRDVVVALAVVIACLAVPDWWEPYGWIAAVAFVPWWFAFVVRIDRDERRLPRGAVLAGAVIGGCIFATYYYPFFIGAVNLLVVLVAQPAMRRHARTFPLRVTHDSWLVLVGAAAVSAVYWLPLALGAARSGAFESLQNRYFDSWMIAFPLPFFDVSVKGVVLLFGLVSIVAGCRRSALMIGLASMLAAAYAWIVLGYVMVLLDSPVLAFRAVFVVEVVLAAGAGVGIVSLVRSARGRDRGASPLSPVLVGVCIALGTVVLAAAAWDAIPYVAQQRQARAPAALLRAYDATMGATGSPVVVTADSDLAVFRPLYTFNVWNAHYSNPLSEFEARSRFLDRLAEEQDPALVAAALRSNRYDAVDALVLDYQPDGTMTYTDHLDNFPRATRSRTLTFTAAQLAAPWFATTNAAGHSFVTVARHPLPALDVAQVRALRAHFAGDLERTR